MSHNSGRESVGGLDPRLGVRWAKLLSYAAMILAGLVFSLPFIWMLSTSLKPDLQSVLRIPPQWIPIPPAWSNYLRAWNSANFSGYMLNSVLVSLSGVLLQITNACLCAYVFSQIEFRGRQILFLLILVVMMIPSQVTFIPNYVILSRLKWLDSYKALIVPFAASGMGTFFIRQAFLGVPKDLIDAAVMDGASHLQILSRIMIPLCGPTIFTLALLTFNWRWNDYFWPLVLTNSDRMRTAAVGIVTLRAGPEGMTNWHTLMAATVIMLLPVLLLFMFFQRYFVQGVARTGLKGA